RGRGGLPWVNWFGQRDVLRHSGGRRQDHRDRERPPDPGPRHAFPPDTRSVQPTTSADRLLGGELDTSGRCPTGIPPERVTLGRAGWRTSINGRRRAPPAGDLECRVRVMISIGDGPAADVAITADPDTPLGDALAPVAPDLGSRPVQVHGRAVPPGTP